MVPELGGPVACVCRVAEVGLVLPLAQESLTGVI
jgi:hypothetical protein